MEIGFVFGRKKFETLQRIDRNLPFPNRNRISDVWKWNTKEFDIFSFKFKFMQIPAKKSVEDSTVNDEKEWNCYMLVLLSFHIVIINKFLSPDFHCCSAAASFFLFLSSDIFHSFLADSQSSISPVCLCSYPIEPCVCVCLFADDALWNANYIYRNEKVLEKKRERRWKNMTNGSHSHSCSMKNGFARRAEV